VVFADRRNWSDDLPSRFPWQGGTNFGVFGPVRLPFVTPTMPRDLERARLAAQAPAMARLLLKNRYKGPTATGATGGCLACGQTESEGCTPGCRLDQVLRAAGVTAPAQPK
jgi:hypothetical protein